MGSPKYFLSLSEHSKIIAKDYLAGSINIKLPKVDYTELIVNLVENDSTANSAILIPLSRLAQSISDSQKRQELERLISQIENIIS